MAENVEVVHVIPDHIIEAAEAAGFDWAALEAKLAAAFQKYGSLVMEFLPLILSLFGSKTSAFDISAFLKLVIKYGMLAEEVIAEILKALQPFVPPPAAKSK